VPGKETRSGEFEIVHDRCATLVRPRDGARDLRCPMTRSGRPPGDELDRAGTPHKSGRCPRNDSSRHSRNPKFATIGRECESGLSQRRRQAPRARAGRKEPHRSTPTDSTSPRRQSVHRCAERLAIACRSTPHPRSRSSIGAQSRCHFGPKARRHGTAPPPEPTQTLRAVPPAEGPGIADEEMPIPAILAGGAAETPGSSGRCAQSGSPRNARIGSKPRLVGAPTVRPEACLLSRGRGAAARAASRRCRQREQHKRVSGRWCGCWQTRCR